MARIYERLRFHVLPRELKDGGLENTLHYNPYEDDTEQTVISPASRRARACARGGR